MLYIICPMIITDPPTDFNRQIIAICLEKYIVCIHPVHSFQLPLVHFEPYFRASLHRRFKSTLGFKKLKFLWAAAAPSNLQIALLDLFSLFYGINDRWLSSYSFAPHLVQNLVLPRSSAPHWVQNCFLGVGLDCSVSVSDGTGTVWTLLTEADSETEVGSSDAGA